VPRARAAPSPRPPRAQPAALDSVDRLVAEWRAVRADLDFSPVEIVSRVRRVHAYLEVELERSLVACGLSGPIFGVLSALRREGPPFQLGQRALMDRLGLTSGTVSVRIDQLVERGLVTRESDPLDRRGALVQLTDQGLDQCDACTPAYLADEDRLLSALTVDQQRQLAGLLGRLLVSFETERPTDAIGAWLGLSLAPAHVARQRQRELGLPERIGLLVRAVMPRSAADSAGLRPGDLLVRVDGRALHSMVTLADAANASAACLRLGVERGGHPLNIDIALDPLPEVGRL
jgi:DNA-binding MarR family transcriptional regulator